MLDKPDVLASIGCAAILLLIIASVYLVARRSQAGSSD